MEPVQLPLPFEDPNTIECPEPEPSLLFDSPTTVRPPDAGFRRAQDVSDALNLYQTMSRIARQEPAADVSPACLMRPRIDLPECAAFEAKWGLKFPVPPEDEIAPERLMCGPIAHPVRIVSDEPSELTLDIWRPAGMVVLDHIAGILDNYQEHREEALPPCWSLWRIDTAVREQFGAAAHDPEYAAEIKEYRDELAGEAGYPSYVNLQRYVRQLLLGSSLEEAAAAENVKAMAVLHRRGIPRRQARKGGDPGEVVMQEQSDEWLRLTLIRPEAVDFGKLAMMLKPRLTRSAVTIRFEETSHGRIFRVQDLVRRGLTASQIAEVMGLEDADSRGRERVAELKAAYGDLVRRLSLPLFSRVR